MDNGHWEFPEQMGTAAYIGFIYVIVDTLTGKKYIGRKSYRAEASGRENDWRRYISSSKLLSEILQQDDREFFRFIVLEQYKTKATMCYAETWTMCQANVAESDVWLNKLIPECRWKLKEVLTARHKQRLDEIISGDY